MLCSFGLDKILDLYYTGVIKRQAFQNSSWERISFSGKAIGDKYGSCKNTNDKYD